MAQFKEKNKMAKETMSAIIIIVFMSIFILSNMFFGFILPLYYLAMFFGLAISLIYPRSGLFSIIFLTMIFERFFTLQSFFINDAEYKIYPLDIVMLGTTLGIGWKIVFAKIKKLPVRKVDLWLVAFILLNAAYFFQSIFVAVADTSIAFSTLKNYAFYSLLYFISAILIRREEDLKSFFKFFLAGALGIVIFIGIGIFRGEGLWSEFTPLSTSGVRILAFTHGLYLSLMVFPVIGWLILRKNKENFFVYVLSIVWIVGIAGTMMRHLWISIFLALAICYFFLSKVSRQTVQKMIFKIFLPIISVVAIAVYAALMLPQSNLSEELQSITGALNERVVSLTSIKTDQSFSWRGLVWGSAFSQFKQNPTLGFGTGKMIYVEEENYRDFIEVRNIHNSYFSILFQLGIVGFSAFAIFVFKNMRKLIKSFQVNKFFLYKFSAFGMLLVFLFSFPFQPYLETNLLALFFWLMLGIARNLGEDEIEISKVEP